MKEVLCRRYNDWGHNLENCEFVLRHSLRVNTLMISQDVLIKRLKSRGVKLEKIPFLKNGFWFDAPFSMSSTPEYLMGYIYIQEAASQVPAEVLAPKSGEIILDACAAPGSKTTHLAQLMKNEGIIVALEPNKSRLDSLKNNIERLGVSNAIVYQLDTRDVASLGVIFDKVLLDAPCSGNCASDPRWFNKRDLVGIKNNSERQINLLDACVKVLKTGGELVYSTCSLEKEEDEDIVEFAVENLGLELIDVGIEKGEVCARHARKFWPDTSGTQGFFVAKFRKI